MVKIILFDADGVLINGEMFSVELEQKYGIAPATTQPFYHGVFKECLIGQKDLKQEITPYLKAWGWQKSVQDYLDKWFAYEHKIDQELIEYIQHLRARGITCLIATNQEKYRAEYMLSKMGFADSFDKLYASAHLGSAKPEAAFFERLVADLHTINKEEILFWDDSSAHITGAREFGIQAELYTSFADFKEKMKQYV